MVPGVQRASTWPHPPTSQQVQVPGSSVQLATGLVTIILVSGVPKFSSLRARPDYSKQKCVDILSLATLKNPQLIVRPIYLQHHHSHSMHSRLQTSPVKQQNTSPLKGKVYVKPQYLRNTRGFIS